MNKKIFIISLAFLLFSFSAHSDASLASKNLPSKKLSFLLIFDQVNYSDIDEQNMPNLKRLMKRSSYGLASVRTAQGTQSTSNKYLSIGTGSRAYASDAALDARNIKDMTPEGITKDVYERRSGARVGDYDIAHLGFLSLQKDNENLNYKIEIGSLGSALNDSGVKTAFFGNSDLGQNIEYVRREASVIAINKYGLINYGDTNALIYDKSFPYGNRTDYKKILSGIDELSKKNESIFFVIDCGDIKRINSYKKSAHDSVITRSNIVAFREFDRFLGGLLKLMKGDDYQLMIASPTPKPEIARNFDQLMPLIVSGKGYGPGTLISNTTRRTGIVTIQDIGPSILQFFNAKAPKSFIGRAIRPVAFDSSPQYFNGLSLRAMSIDRMRPVLITVFIFAQIIGLILAGYCLFAKGVGSRVVSFTKTYLVGLLITPMFFFINPIMFNPQSQIIYGLGLVFLIVISAYILPKIIKDGISLIAVVCLSTTGLVFLDLLTGGRLNITSILGYSPMTAGRFYGIGNQMMSVMIVCTIFGAAAVLEMVKNRESLPARVLTVLFFILVTAVMAIPSLGANTGGTVTALIAFYFTYIFFTRGKLKVMDIVAILVVGVSLFSLLFLYDSTFNVGKETHLTRAITSISAGGIPEFSLYLQRKIATNWRIFKYSSWSWLLLVIIVFLSSLRFRPIGKQEKLVFKYKYIAAGTSGAIVAAIVGFLTNDSGISIPALIFSIYAPIVLYLTLCENDKEIDKAV